MDSKMCRECCGSASSRPLLLGLTERGRNTASFPSRSVRAGGCRLVGDDAAGDRTNVALVAACRRRSCRSKQHTLPPLLLLLAAAVVVTETANVGQRNTYSRQEGGNFVPQPPPLSLEPHVAPSAADSRARSPFAFNSVPATGRGEQRAGNGGADTVNLWPSYESPAEHSADSGKRNRRQLVEHCATKMSGAGYFMTPQYPQLVTDGAYTCFWQLSVVYAGQTVSLDLSDLQESRGDSGGSSGDQHDDCGDSYVAVADLSGHVVRYCKPQPRPVLVGENVYVWASGHAQDSFGLRANFRSTFSTPDWNPTPPVCGGRFQAGDAFATPRYPSAYPTTRTCFWAAAATAGHRLTLTFDSFDVGRDATCESDYVTVWTSERGLMPRLCGNVIPANVSTGAYIFVFFSSDGVEDGGAIGLRARFVTDGETRAYTTTEVATTKAATVGVSLLTVIGATSAQPWSSAGGSDSSSSSSRPASADHSTTATASLSTLAGGSTESWATTPQAGGQATSTTIASVSANADSTPQPSASSISYASRMTTATLDRTHSTTAAEAATTSRRPASSSVSGTGSRSTTRFSQTLGDSAATTTIPATVQPEPEFLSSSLSPDTTLQPGGSRSTLQSDGSSSIMPLPTGSATPEQQSTNTAQQQQPRTVQPTSEASVASSRTTTTLLPTTTTRRRCKLRQKPAADVASQSPALAAPPR